MSSVASLRGKKILITSYSYAQFGGAELNATELADQLLAYGMVPTFFSYDIDGPFRDYIENRYDTVVLTDRIRKLSESESREDMGYTSLDINDYDYIWVGGNTVPISIIKQINSAKKLPKFIFIHMSALIAFPLDAPLMPEFQSKIASRTLTISDKTTQDVIYRILGDDVSVGEWLNPVPAEFRDLGGRSQTLEKVAVISSSHPSEEVMELGNLLARQGVEVDYVGRFIDNQKVVDASFYDKYDLIVGIGKNAKYSLVSGVPIYIYGRFGGGGYISEDNIQTNKEQNFSGRGFARKTADVICNEIVDGYSEALKFHKKKRKYFAEELSIDSVAQRLFEGLEMEPNRSVSFDDRYINWLVSFQITLLQRHMRTMWLREEGGKLKQLEEEVEKLGSSLEIAEAKYKDYKSEIQGIYRSKSWNITRPLRFIGDLARKSKNRLGW